VFGQSWRNGYSLEVGRVSSEISRRLTSLDWADLCDVCPCAWLAAADHLVTSVARCSGELSVLNGIYDIPRYAKNMQ